MLQDQLAGNQPFRVGFLLVPGYSGLAFSSAMDPLRMANQLTGKELYAWPVITVDGKAVAASNGVRIAPDAAIDDIEKLDLLFVCGGIHIHDACDKRILTWLRRLAAKEVALGAVCTGTYVLAVAGVLKGYRCTIHWENISTLNEEQQFPETIFSSELFVIDRDRYTCSGGIAPLDMMLNLIHRQHGQKLAQDISEEFIHERIRTVSDMQRVPLRISLGTSQPKLVDAVTLMEANLEEPLALDELAFHVDISRRQLERLFRKYLNCPPSRYYLELRLQRARQFLLQTDMPIIDIALACGFSSPPHFSKSYRDFFGRSPSAARRRQTEAREKKPSLQT
ncbi:MAG TPA: GlxA family transcriptional regulator [Salinisphaeraceae bacterium]|nr:GlxA family transcriptional regulator [Salinisphaeraceae bacterium]